MRPRFQIIGSLVILGLAMVSCGQGSSPPNLVVVTLDTFRADRMGNYGYFRETTPALDDLANESLVFEHCYAPMATTFPSHLSLLTGVYPNEHGALANGGDGGGQAFVPNPRLRSIAQIVSGHGYATAAFVSAAPLKRFSGIAVGFDTFDQPEDRQRVAADTNERVMAWLDAPRSKPFFLWAHYFDPHSLYQPPKPFDVEFETDERQRAYLQQREFSDGLLEHGRGGLELTAAQTNNLYDGEVRYLDSQLGILFERLRRDPEVWRNTVVIVVGDHGEGLGQHDERYHGGVWGEQLRVPLLVRLPGHDAQRYEHPLSVVDVFPTVFNRVEIPGAIEFLRQASGRDRINDRSAENFVVSQESGAPWRYTQARSQPSVSITGLEWKLIHNPNGDDELYRLSADPFELHDVRGVNTTIAADLLGQLRLRLRRQRARGLELRDEGAPAAKVDSATVEQLRALGYF